jgi:hypothetical protein
MTRKNTKSLDPDIGIPIPRLSKSEVGFTGLRVLNKAILEESNRAFRFPAFLKTVQEMRTDATICAVLNVYRMMLTRVPWTVTPPVDPTPAEIDRAKFVQSCMDDMETTWKQFISETLTYLEYGFAVEEKVYRRRLNINGSKHNDGLIGLRTIAPRGQDTIRHWYFSDDGRELEGVGQSLRNMENGYRYQVLIDQGAASKDGLLNIDRDKFLLFTADSVKGNPEGRSILKSVYLPYKQLTMLKDQLFLGIAKDLAAVPIVKLPSKVMNPAGSAEEIAAYTAYQTLVNNVADGVQRGVVIPSDVDPETKAASYSFELLEAKGQSKFDIPAVIKAIQTDILVALSADVITAVADTQGSFSIKDNSTNLLAIAVEHRLNEIRDVLNGDLVPQIFALNGWSQDRLPTFEYGDIVDTGQEEFSKAIQRMASVGMIEIDREILNKIRTVLGVDPKPDDEPVNFEDLSANTTRASDGLEAGRSGDGTSVIGGEGSKVDRSAANADNAA